jgi:hypothetical protein
MGNIKRTLTLILIGVIAFSYLNISTVKQANAQTISQLSAPEFTIRYADHSYDTQPTYTTDPYTGKTVLSQEGSHVWNSTITLTIQNQPFNQYTDSNGSSIGLYYTISFKGHFESNWNEYNTYYMPNGDGTSTELYFEYSHAASTVVVFGSSANSGWEFATINLPQITEGQLDFKVKAYTAYFVTVEDPVNPFNIRHPYHTEQIVTTSSDWSGTQTISIPDGSVINSLNPTITPNPPVTTSLTPTVTKEPTSSQTENHPAETEISLPLATLAVVIVVVALVASAISILAYKKFTERTAHG